MAQFVVAAAGAAIGFAAGGPTGAQIGWGIGAMVGSALGPGQHTEGPRLQDLRAPKAQYGAKWPRIYGRVRTAGIVIWQSDLEEVASTTSVGKGGPEVSSTTFNYFRSVLFGFSEFHFGATIKPVAVTRIWRNGKLIWSALNDSEAATLDASAATTAFDSFTFFDGNASQMPWTVYEAAVGTANANAYRYRATGGMERIAYGASDQMPYFEFEVVTSATETVPDEVPVIGPWKWIGPFTGNCGGEDGTDYIFATAQDAAGSRLGSWIPCYLNHLPSDYTDPTWLFLDTGGQEPPDNDYLVLHDGQLGVQYYIDTGDGPAGQQGLVKGQITFIQPPTSYTPLTVDLADIVAQEHLRANGGVSSEFDVSELVGIPVHGCAFAGTARSAIEQLMPAFYL